MNEIKSKISPLRWVQFDRISHNYVDMIVYSDCYNMFSVMKVLTRDFNLDTFVINQNDNSNAV